MAYEGFNMNVLTYDPYLKEKPDYVNSVSNLKDLLENSDFISLHVGLNEETRHMISKEEIKLMKPETIIINCGRGGLINEDDLIEAIENNKIAGAGLDVTEEEPLNSDSRLFKYDNVIVTPHYAPNTFETSIRDNGISLEFKDLVSEDEIIAECQDATAILATGNPPLNGKVINSLPKLKYIQRFGIGVNSIDLEEATKNKVIVLNLPGFCSKELADLSLAMILGLIRNVNYYDRKIRDGYWPKCKYYLPPNLRNMTLGLFGFGTAGKELYKIVKNGFGTKVLVYDPYISEEAVNKYDVKSVSFTELLKESDIISIHSKLTRETNHIFDKEAFKNMKETAMIINTARGQIIKEEDLVWALENNQIRYAGLDTFEYEPIDKKNPLLKMDNVLLNPHSGSYGSRSKEEQIKLVSTIIPLIYKERRLKTKYIANKEVIKDIDTIILE